MFTEIFPMIEVTMYLTISVGILGFFFIMVGFCNRWRSPRSFFEEPAAFKSIRNEAMVPGYPNRYLVNGGLLQPISLSNGNFLVARQWPCLDLFLFQCGVCREVQCDGRVRSWLKILTTTKLQFVQMGVFDASSDDSVQIWMYMPADSRVLIVILELDYETATYTVHHQYKLPIPLTWILGVPIHYIYGEFHFLCGSSNIPKYFRFDPETGEITADSICINEKNTQRVPMDIVASNHDELFIYEWESGWKKITNIWPHTLCCTADGKYAIIICPSRCFLIIDVCRRRRLHWVSRVQLKNVSDAQYVVVANPRQDQVITERMVRDELGLQMGLQIGSPMVFSRDLVQFVARFVGTEYLHVMNGAGLHQKISVDDVLC